MAAPGDRAGSARWLGARPVVGVLALQGDVREHLRMLADSGAEALPVRRPAELAAVDALVIPGGESTTIVRLARIFDLLEPIRARLATGMPALGTCAGMILLADRLVGGTGRRRARSAGSTSPSAGTRSDGRSTRSRARSSFAGFDTPLHAVFIRAPWVEEVGASVEVLARVAAGSDPGRIVAVRQGRVMATSFHPEISGDPRVHRYFVTLVASRT